MEIKEPHIQKVTAVLLQTNPPDAKQPLLTGNEINVGNDADVKRTCSLPDINVARNAKMLKDLANMEQLKVQPWANQAHFMPLTTKELVKYGHIPPLPAYVVIRFFLISNFASWAQPRLCWGPGFQNLDCEYDNRSTCG